MEQYTATFHTHLAALRTCRALNALGIQAQMAPVPRSLSSSCGTCVRYSAPDPCLNQMDQDTEAVYRLEEKHYMLVRQLS